MTKLWPAGRIGRRGDVPERCVICGVRVHTRHKGRSEEGTREYGCRGACQICYNREIRGQRAGGQKGRRTRSWPADNLLDEYQMIREDVVNVQQAAERMGIGFSRLDKALYRARQRGDARGNVPPAQIERAIDKGCPPAIAKEAS